MEILTLCIQILYIFIGIFFVKMIVGIYVDAVLTFQ